MCSFRGILLLFLRTKNVDLLRVLVKLIQNLLILVSKLFPSSKYEGMNIINNIISRGVVNLTNTRNIHLQFIDNFTKHSFQTKTPVLSNVFSYNLFQNSSYF